MNLDGFPTELLNEIFSFLPVYTDIRRLCLVSQRFRDIASPILYKKVVLRAHSRTIIQHKDYWSLIKLRNHRCLHLIRYSGIDSRSCGVPYKPLAEKFDHDVDSITLRFLKKLKRGQLKGLIITDARLLSDALLAHITKNQRRIESIYEINGPRALGNLFPMLQQRWESRDGLVKTLLSGRRGLTDISLCELRLEDLIPLINFLRDNQDGLASLELDLGVFYPYGVTINHPFDLKEMHSSLQRHGVKHTLSEYGVDVDNPPKLVNLKKLTMCNIFSLQTAALDPFTKSMLDFSNLTFLKLWSCGGGGTELLVAEGVTLRLKTLWIVDRHDYEGPEQVLRSFQGLKELVLEYPHDPGKLVEPIKNHAETLEKLYWRSIVEHHGAWGYPDTIGLGKLLPGFSMLDFGMFGKLKELGLCVANEEPLSIKFTFPPKLKLFHVLQTQNPQIDPLNYPTVSEVSNFCRKIIPPDAERAPFKYFAMGLRRVFKDWPRMLELYMENMDKLKPEDAYLVTKKFAFREMDEKELAELHPQLGFVSEMEEWMPWDLRRKFGTSAGTTKFSILRS